MARNENFSIQSGIDAVSPNNTGLCPKRLPIFCKAKFMFFKLKNTIIAYADIFNLEFKMNNFHRWKGENNKSELLEKIYLAAS